MIAYTIAWTDPNEHLFDITVSFTAPADEPLLKLPAWRPGRYLIQNTPPTSASGAPPTSTFGQPGKEVLSLSQASFDSWLQNDAHDRANALISFYNKGEIVAAMLDLTILQRSDGTRSLDDVMLLLWREQKPLPEDGFERAVASICDVGDFFVRYVHGRFAAVPGVVRRRRPFVRVRACWNRSRSKLAQ